MNELCSINHIFYLYFALDVLKTAAQEEENKVQDTL